MSSISGLATGRFVGALIQSSIKPSSIYPEKSEYDQKLFEVSTVYREQTGVQPHDD
jgi:hypothetical protein